MSKWGIAICVSCGDEFTKYGPKDVRCSKACLKKERALKLAEQWKADDGTGPKKKTHGVAMRMYNRNMMPKSKQGD
jgi:hypothetical protein